MSKFINDDDEIWEKIENEDYIDEASETNGESIIIEQVDSLFEEGEKEEYLDNLVIEITHDNGVKDKCEVVGRMDIDGNSYIILYPLTNNPSGSVFIEKFVAGEDDELVFVAMDNEEEIQLVTEEYHKLMEG